MGRDNLKERLFFGIEDVATAYEITRASAHVLCSRYVKQGVFVRIKRNFYVLDRNWEKYGTQEFFKISNLLQVPSYVSCTTALAFFGITTQIQRDWYENVSMRRSTSMEARGISFIYHKLQPALYFGFTRQEGVFMADPEKALLDAAYLDSIGRYSLDWSALNMEALNKEKLADLLDPFPERLKGRIAEKCRIS
jgi:predicted transcriptional regulator of viral defense system